MKRPSSMTSSTARRSSSRSGASGVRVSNSATATATGTLPFGRVLVLASVTDSVVTFATHVVRDLGLPGVFLLMLLESACIPIPSEATMLFAGFNVSSGDHTLLAITIAGVLGNLVGSWLAYAVGYFGRIELVERHGKWLHI